MRERFQCPECDCPNEVGRIFCIRCGVKLDFTRMQRKLRIDFGAMLESLLRLVIFAAVLVVVVFIVWPLEPVGQVGGADDARGWLGKRDALKAGEVKEVEVSEALINAYLVSTLKQPLTNATESVGSWQMKLDALNVAFRADHVMLTAVTQWGPLTITWAIGGVPRVRDERSTFEVINGRLGHLPLPRMVVGWVADRMAALLVRWPQDRDVLDQLQSVTLGAGRVTLIARADQAR